jgi:hypothetical protein
MFFGFPETPERSPFRDSYLRRTPAGQHQARRDEAVGQGSLGNSPLRMFAPTGVLPEDAAKEIVLLRLRLVYLDELLHHAGHDLDLAAEASIARAEYEALHADYRRVMDELQELRARHAAVAREGDDLRVRAADLEQTLRDRPSSQDLATAERAAASANAGMGIAQAEVKHLREELERARLLQSDQQRQHAAALAAANETHQRQIEGERATLREALEVANQERDSWKRQTEAAQQRVQKASSELAQMGADLTSAKVTHDTLRSLVEETRAELGANTRELESTRDDGVAAQQAVIAMHQVAARALTALVRAAGTTDMAGVVGLLNGPAEAVIARIAQLEREIETGQFERARLASEAEVAAVRRLGNDASQFMETCFGGIGAALRRVTDKAGHAKAAMDALRAKSRRDTEVVRGRFAALEAKARDREQRAREERLASDVASAVGVAAATVQKRVEEDLRNVASEIKAAFINTNVLTREFLTKIDDEVRRSSTMVRQLSDVAEANWRSSSRDSNFGGSGEATKLSPTSSQAVAQTLVRTCQNIVALLDTNLAQATEHERRLSLLLTQIREDVADDLIEFERRVVGLLRISPTTADEHMRTTSPGRRPVLVQPPTALSPAALSPAASFAGHSPLVDLFRPPVYGGQRGGY